MGGHSAAWKVLMTAELLAGNSVVMTVVILVAETAGWKVFGMAAERVVEMDCVLVAKKAQSMAVYSVGVKDL